MRTSKSKDPNTGEIKKTGSPMLSPKMQRAIRVNENQLLMLSERAHNDHQLTGYLHKRSGDSTKWQLRYFVLYQNILFYYDSEYCSRPSGMLFLEGSYCERLITTEGVTSTAPKAKDKDKQVDKQFCFAISYRKDNIRQYELCATNENDCKNWIETIKEASFSKLRLQKDELEQKHLHLLQIVESEQTAKWQYSQQCEELATDIKNLREELTTSKKERKTERTAYNMIHTCQEAPDSSCLCCIYEELEGDVEKLNKLKKVQSFFRGWLCRRKWKQIVEQYIKSPHAERLRKRNSLVFKLVEAEEEYMEQMEVLVTCFLRPFKMAASSKKPPCTHEDVNSIFLNSETVFFLHQIFLKGLTSRLESWPTLVLGDLFSMLLPMLTIYQEYVRNHHYSLQVLTECKQSQAFAATLKRLESKPSCNGRSLETFLTFPMHQIPRYIITLHELLAHTPFEHVERKSLENAQLQLENLSKQMHNEVSETENLRKNLAVERMIVEGCDILLDVNQVFVRQGSLVQIPSEKPKGSKSKLSFRTEKEVVRQCYLFSYHLILATRAQNGKLHLVPEIGKIPLAEAILVEDPSEADEEESTAATVSSQSSQTSEASVSGYHNRDFKILVESRTSLQLTQICVHLVASTIQEKAAWISDISQCIDNVQFNDLMRPQMTDSSSISVPHCVRNDPKLYTDEPDIRFSRNLNSCKVPQIRYATPERLLQRLTDLRFLSIDFLNTFLLTYKVFTDSETVLSALKKVFYASYEKERQDSMISLETFQIKEEHTLQLYDDSRRRSSLFTPRRTSGASSVSGYGSETSDRDRSHSYDSQGHKIWKASLPKYDEEAQENGKKPSPTLHVSETLYSVSIRVDSAEEPPDAHHLSIPKVQTSSSSETLTDVTVLSVSHSNESSKTLLASSPSPSDVSPEPGTSKDSLEKMHEERKERRISEEKRHSDILIDERRRRSETIDRKGEEKRKPSEEKKKSTVDTQKPGEERKRLEEKRKTQPARHGASPSSEKRAKIQTKRSISLESEDQPEERQPPGYVHRSSTASSRSASISVQSTTSAVVQGFYRRSMQEGESSTTRSSFQHDSPQKRSRAGVVITSFRQSKRRSSTSTTAQAFAIATSGSSNPTVPLKNEEAERARQMENIMSTAATMRVLNVLRHWISKQCQDFENDQQLKAMTRGFLEEIRYCPNLLPAEHKAAAQLLRLLDKDETESQCMDLQKLLTSPLESSKDSIETLSALEIAEQLTFIDHQIFISISSEEFIGQAWMKSDKEKKAPHILMMTKRFNDVSRLVASEILRRSSITARVSAIEKWAAVADIARCLHNFNGVLQICSAFSNASIFRLKKTWEKVSKTAKQTIEKLQKIVSSDGRFRALRDALHKCDPPCIPYLGLYLTDLSFIEEGTPNFVEEGLLNFSKMRMIAHVTREIRHFQQTPYKIDLITRVSNYLLDTSLLMSDDDLYNTSLKLEPRAARLITQSSLSKL